MYNDNDVEGITHSPGDFLFNKVKGFTIVKLYKIMKLHEKDITYQAFVKIVNRTKSGNGLFSKPELFSEALRILGVSYEEVYTGNKPFTESMAFNELNNKLNQLEIKIDEIKSFIIPKQREKIFISDVIDEAKEVNDSYKNYSILKTFNDKFDYMPLTLHYIELLKKHKKNNLNKNIILKKLYNYFDIVMAYKAQKTKNSEENFLFFSNSLFTPIIITTFGYFIIDIYSRLKRSQSIVIKKDSGINLNTDKLSEDLITFIDNLLQKEDPEIVAIYRNINSNSIVEKLFMCFSGLTEEVANVLEKQKYYLKDSIKPSKPLLMVEESLNKKKIKKIIIKNEFYETIEYIFKKLRNISQDDVEIYNERIYVNEQINDKSQNGKLWQTAFQNIDMAINYIEENNLNYLKNIEIWVASGMYKAPENDCLLKLLSNVTIYGGFAGKERKLRERDIENNKTVLTSIDSKYIVINFFNDIYSNTVIDGFIIHEPFKKREFNDIPFNIEEKYDEQSILKNCKVVFGELQDYNISSKKASDNNEYDKSSSFTEKTIKTAKYDEDKENIKTDKKTKIRKVKINEDGKVISTEDREIKGRIY